MKRNLLLVFTVLLLSIGTTMANTVVVKGTVKDSANNPVANRTVRIYNNDSTIQSCLIAHAVVTNPNGYYIDTLQCNGDIRKLMVVVENCNGAKIIQTPTAINTVVEVNFVICVPGAAPAPCKSNFNFTATNTGFKFNSGYAYAPAGDSIISRTWVFGDSSQPLTGNRVDPTHDYAKGGVYNVCLTIKTKKGCESSFCTTVTMHDTVLAPTNCKAYFSATVKDSVVYFSSKGSAAPDGDSIISRTWYYIDSATNTQLVLNGNTIDTFITYNGKPGKYTVYLVIKTKKGCESKFSGSVVIPPKPSTCTLVPQVSFERVSARKIRFSSANSYAQGDSITSRRWVFGDGTVLEGNEISPLKEYKDTGVYNVCVTMKTKNGCEKTFCLVVPVRDSVTTQPATCKALFTYGIYNNGLVKFNSAGSVGVSAEDSVIGRTWIFGDSSAAVTNLVDPSHTYAKAGSYVVYLYIKTKKGCESKYTATVVIPTQPNTCTLTAQVSFEKISTYKFRFFSDKSTAQGDSIISRKWNFGDGTGLDGNEINPTKEYKDTGKYTVTLTMKTKAGCEKTFYLVALVRDSIPQPVPTNCKAVFTFTIQNNATVKFNSAGSAGTSADDEIISRTWIFGDSSTVSGGTTGTNSIDPSHNYTKPGSYTVYLYIKTKKGCESKYSATVVIAPTATNCPVEVSFVATRISPKKVQFNSEQSHAQAGDSIIQRKWKFGDGTALEGNTINPAKEFPMIGIYNTCLEVKTAKGCVAQVCKQVSVQDTTGLPTVPKDHIKLVTLTPNPVVTRMLATIWSSGNIEVEITIFDVYGLPKLKLKKTLTQGTNIIEIPASNLYRGPYYLTVSSKNEKDSKIFYKL